MNPIYLNIFKESKFSWLMPFFIEKERIIEKKYEDQ